MRGILDRLLDLAIRIQQVPSPTFQEAERAALVRDLFMQEQLAEVELDAAGNVLACLAARRPSGGRVQLVVSAHLDTVFPPGTDLATRREQGRLYGPGIGDNAVGVAGLFGLLWRLRETGRELPFDLWLAANVGEEGLGDLRGMKALADRFGSRATYVILEGMPVGHVYHRGLGVRRYRLSVQTQGGHSWLDYGRPSAIHELTRLSAGLTRLEVPKAPRTTLNIGVIAGGTSVNTIAAQARLELDLRSEDPSALEALARQVEALCRRFQRPGVEVGAEVIGSRPAGEIPADHPLVRLACDCLREAKIEPRLAIGSTDANIPLSRGYPAVTLGLTTGSGAHTLHEYINVEPLEKGVGVLCSLVAGFAGL